MKSKIKDISEIGIRAKAILAEVVEVYLNQGSPVSSKLISEKLDSPLSPSSIRMVKAICIHHIRQLGEFQPIEV